MATHLIVQGGEIELHESESFNKARHRLNKAKKLVIDYENGNIDGNSKDEKFDPFHQLSFRTAFTDDDYPDGGRISVDPVKVIGVRSDDHKDLGGGSDED